MYGQHSLRTDSHCFNITDVPRASSQRLAVYRCRCRSKIIFHSARTAVAAAAYSDKLFTTGYDGAAVSQTSALH